MKRFMLIAAVIVIVTLPLSFSGCATIGGTGNNSAVARAAISQLLQIVAAGLNAPAPTTAPAESSRTAFLESVEGPSLGQTLYAKGYTGTVWVSSFDPALSHLSHGVFHPDIPVTDAVGRYGMQLYGTGTITIENGAYIATGVAGPSPQDGALFIDLLSNGNRLDSESLPFSCATVACPWKVLFHHTKAPTSGTLSLKIYRHVEGSTCGGELTIDLNAECHDKLVAALGLPTDYVFTQTDHVDTNYVAKPGAATSALCAEIFPICKSGTGAGTGGVIPPPPPPPDPCAGGCSSTCPSKCAPPPPLPPSPPQAVCPEGLSCRGECSPCLSCPVYVTNIPPDNILATLRELVKGKNKKLKATITWVLSNPGLRLP